jgi:hypothetical protein
MNRFYSLLSSLFLIPTMTEILVQQMPKAFRDELEKKGCTVPKHCFANCSLAVTNLGIADTYVLCFVEMPDGEKQGHALIKIRGNYYDPTLEQVLPAAHYWLKKEFSKDELIAFVKTCNTDTKIDAFGNVEIYPPALRSDGEIVCEEIVA